MAYFLLKNRAESTLAAGISDADLSLTVATGEGALFPATGDFLITICAYSGGTESNIEIVKCTARTDDALTIVRAQEGTSAVSHAQDELVELRITAGVLEDIESKVVSKTDYNANTIIYATTDDTPTTLTVGEQTVVGRLTGDNISAITLGIADNNIVQIDQADAADNDIVKFTADGLEGRSYSELRGDLGVLESIDEDTMASNLDTKVPTQQSVKAYVDGIKTITAVLAQTMAENDAIKLDVALSADGKYNGITRTGTAGATLAFGDVVYLAVADSRWELAKADAEATTKCLLGICVLAAASDGDPTNILLIGMVRADTAFPSFTVGAPVFLDASTAGDLTSTVPTGSGNCIRAVGQAWTADELWFCPSPDWYKHA